MNKRPGSQPKSRSVSSPHFVEIVLPGNHRWCQRVQAGIRQWFEIMARSEHAAGVTVAPAVRVEGSGKVSELILTWHAVPADGWSTAVDKARAVIALCNPGLLDHVGASVLVGDASARL